MIIKNICVCKRNKKRVNIYDEKGFAFSCYVDTVFNYDLKKDALLSEEKMREIIHTDEVKFATDEALKLLGVRLRSEEEIRRALAKKEISGESIEETIDNLYGFELIDDCEFAEIYARELAEKYGEKMIAKKLNEKGVAWEIANKAASKHKRIDTLKAHYERARKRLNGKTDYETNQKIVRSLLNKGFNYDDITQVINGANEE